MSQVNDFTIWVPCKSTKEQTTLVADWNVTFTRWFTTSIMFKIMNLIIELHHNITMHEYSYTVEYS